MIHIDPDFKELSLPQRKSALQALHVISEHSEELRPSGVTQLKLVHAIGSSLLGVDVPEERITNDRTNVMDDFSKNVIGIKTEVKQRLFQLFILTELILDPIPYKATKALQEIADILNVEDAFIEVAREYSMGAYGVAASDLHRKGYMGDPNLIKKGGEKMRVHKSFTDPFENDEEDPELLQQWMDLEKCADDTLGKNIWRYYSGRGFVFTGQKGSVNPTIAQHDWIHLLADYGTTIENELEVFAFIGSSIPDIKGFSFLIAIISLFETGRLESWGGGVLNADRGHLDLPGMPERLADAIRRGRICNLDVMYGIDYFDYKDMPIDEVRQKLRIVPKAEDVSSPGVWDPNGITSYQRDHGDPKYQPPLAN
jgi:hypothetical protein